MAFARGRHGFSVRGLPITCKSLTTQRAVVAADQRATRLFGAGLADYLQVLTTQRAVVAADDAAAQGDLARVQAVMGYLVSGAWRGLAGGELFPQGLDRKAFFFEKKKQKTFMS